MRKRHKIEHQLSALRSLASRGKADCKLSDQRFDSFFYSLEKRIRELAVEIEGVMPMILKEAAQADGDTQ